MCYPVENRFETEATKWGLNHEKVAIRCLIRKLEEDEHENVRVENCGIFVSEDHPFIRATPDSIILCDCCGKQLVEVKCPFTKKDELLNVTDEKANFYLKKDESGELHLDNNHEYFFQVQTQMEETKVESCLFVVWTTVDLHVEQILFDGGNWQEMCLIAEHFFEPLYSPSWLESFTLTFLVQGYRFSQHHHHRPAMKTEHVPVAVQKNIGVTVTKWSLERWCVVTVKIVTLSGFILNA